MPYLAIKDSSVGICDWTALPLGGREINEKGTYYIYIYRPRRRLTRGRCRGRPILRSGVGRWLQLRRWRTSRGGRCNNPMGRVQISGSRGCAQGRGEVWGWGMQGHGGFAWLCKKMMATGRKL